MTFCLYFQSSSPVNSLNTVCREALERKHFPWESKPALRHLFDGLQFQQWLRDCGLICVLSICWWSVALRRNFSSPELGLAVFCVIQSECSQLQGSYLNLQAQGFAKHWAWVSRTEGKIQHIEIYLNSLWPVSSNIVAITSLGVSSWGKRNNTKILRQTEPQISIGAVKIHNGAPSVERRCTALKRFCPSSAWQRKIQYLGHLFLCPIPFAAL